MINTDHEVSLRAPIGFVIWLFDSHYTTLWQAGENGRFALVVQSQFLNFTMLIFYDRDGSDTSIGIADGLDDDDLAVVMRLDAQRTKGYLRIVRYELLVRRPLRLTISRSAIAFVEGGYASDAPGCFTALGALGF